MLNSRFPVSILKGTLGICLAVLLIAPAAVLYSAGELQTGTEKTRGPVQKLSSGQDNTWWVEQELAWSAKRARPLYERASTIWTPERGPSRLGTVDLAMVKSPKVLHLGAKGSFDTSKGSPAIGETLRARSNAKGGYLLIQFKESAIRGKTTREVRQMLVGMGVESIDSPIPNNGYLVKPNSKGRQKLLTDPRLEFAGDFEPGYKIHPGVGASKSLSPSRANSDLLDVSIRTFKGQDKKPVLDHIADLGGEVSHVQDFNGRSIIRASIHMDDIFELAHNPGIKGIENKRERVNMSLVTSIQTEVGRFLDPRIEGKFVRPFNEEGIDGGGTYSTAVDVPTAGCAPYSDGDAINPACYSVPPQYIGLADNGIDLDSAPLAHSSSDPCVGGSCASLSTGAGVGSSHRKVEVYVTSKDHNHDGANEDGTGEGDFLSCSSLQSGGDSHGHLVAGTMLGNPTAGQFGLGFVFEDKGVSNQFFSYFNNENEVNLPMDGQASGARLIFVDGMGTGVPVNGPPPCATNLLSDVDFGASVVDEVETMIYRRDINLANGSSEPSLNADADAGAKIVVLPFGAPTDFDDNNFNGHGTYSGDAEDLDDLLFNNRRVVVVVPVGNDGTNPATGSKRDPFQPTDANDGVGPDPLLDLSDLMVGDLATGKNIISVGSNRTDTLARSIDPLDATSFINFFSSKGPRTLAAADGIAPLLVAPGFEASSGAGREGEYDSDYFSSHAVIMSFDDEQDTAEGVEIVRNQQKAGTSLSSGKVGGAAAQARDYLAKGYYPAGIAGTGASILDPSGALIKAILVGSSNFKTSALIASCTNAFCIEEGYGAVELANILPLKSYGVTRRPADSSNLSNGPDVPVNILLVDELFDGGLGYGVVELGSEVQYEFDVYHGGASVRAALAWYDAPSETVVNNLDLELIDSDQDRTIGWDVAFATAGPGSGMCSSTAFGGIFASACGFCTIPSLVSSAGNSIADGPYYDPNPSADPNASNPFVRRYLGNNLVDRQRFTQFADCDGGGALDGASPNSTYDTGNTTEFVHLYHSNGFGVLGANRGSGSEGFYKAVVSYPDTGIQIGAPNTPCVVPASGSSSLDTSTAAGNDVVLTTRDGLQYIASGVDNPGTAGVDEAQCDSSASGTDQQLVSNGAIGQPFGMVVTGPINYTGSGRTQIELDQTSYDCSETSLQVSVTEEDTLAANIAAQIASGTTIQVLDGSGGVVDVESGLSFSNTFASSVFRIYRDMAYTSSGTRVQFIGNLGRSPIHNNGMIEVEDGDTIVANYTDPGDPGDTATSRSSVLCTPQITQSFIGLAVQNVQPKFIGGGCDEGRNINLRGDFSFDAGEDVQYSVFGTNHAGYEIKNLTATLNCANVTAVDVCSLLSGAQGQTVNIGRVPFGRQFGATFSVSVAAGAAAISGADGAVDLTVSFAASNSDSGAQLATQSFTYREAVQSDNERVFYSTDAPFGGTRIIDYNQNGQIERTELGNGGRREEREIRTYQDWSANNLLGNPNPNAGLLTACGGASCLPFDFDSNGGSFSARLAGDSKPGAGYPTSSQGWFNLTGGACGWQTQASTGGASAAKGVWHAGNNATGVLGSGCGQYVIPSDAATDVFTEFVNHILTSPTFNKVNQGTDARGFEFDLRAESLSWNSNEEIVDTFTVMTVDIDMDTASDTGIVLGDSYSYRPPFAVSNRTNSVNGARRFGPTFDPDGSIAGGSGTTGDEVGITGDLAAYDAGSFLERNFMPTPAADADGNGANGFTSDERISDGVNCPPVAIGEPCRSSGFTTASGPVRNRDIDTGGTFEDFRGAAGNTFAFEFQFTANEGGAQGTGWTIDNVEFTWSEQHPTDQVGFAGGDCSLDNTGGFTCIANTCGGGSPRDGLFCNGIDDCVDVILEGTCSGAVCSAGRVGLGCGVDNDCDLGRCVAGNSELGCSADADCNHNTNDCDAIPFRVSPTSGGNSATSSACGNISYEKRFLYDCTSSIKVTVQDSTPNLCGPATDIDNDGNADGCSVAPAQVIVNARSGQEPLGESFILSETSGGSGVFEGVVPLSAVQNQENVLFLDSDPGERVNMTVSYDDPECDADKDGELNETNFKDIDGDGVPNFGADSVLKDQHPTLSYVTGGKVTDDDNCFNSLNSTDVFNPAASAQLDLNGDGIIDASDCIVGLGGTSGQCDFDSDGVGDICDNCPATANGDQLDTDGDGIGFLCENNDIDNDGILNSGDNCPTVYNPSQAQSGGNGPGGSRFNRGELCDSGSDIDLDGVDELTDNCPNEQIEEDGGVGFNPGPCPGGATACTYNPDQRDTDADGVGDVCDDEDFDKDGVINILDNCVTVYNPADPAFQSQTDSVGDGAGDDRAGNDTVGRCVGGPTPGALCLPIATGANCGAGGFCVQSADQYCDPDSQDDNNGGTPDDLVAFNTEINCNYAPGGLGAKTTEVAAVSISGASIVDDGTADHTCVSGDPDPNNDPSAPEDCPVANAGAPGDASCDTPGGGGGDGDCEPVPDGIVDPGELSSVALTVANQTLDSRLNGRTLTNATIGITSTSASIGCITKGQTFVGTLPAGGLVTTPSEGLQFILSPTTGQSSVAKFAEADFTMTVVGDGIEANTPPQTFKISGDSDQVTFGPIPPACGIAASGSSLDPNHGVAGVLCEDFDTDRNTNGTFEYTRLYPAAGPDPLAGVPDLGDDVLGHNVDGGPLPFGVDGQICASDAVFGGALASCFVVPSENDWHLHSSTEGCDPAYEPDASFSGRCDGGEARAHSGTRSMHMGRHLNATDTLYDTYRLRQTSAFIMDPVNLGTASGLEFWHLIQVCDDTCVNAGSGGTTAGGQVQISLLDNNTGLFERWQRLSATNNGYNSLDQEIIVICEFDPGDDQLPPNDETMCGGQPQWSDIGDIYGTDVTCVTDTDANDPINADCGETTNRTVDACSWVSDPACGSFLETGSAGRGVWAKSTFDLAAFSGRRARLRWIMENGGGWGFGESRSFLEPPSGAPFFAYDQDDGWYVDSIKVTDLRTSPAVIKPDPDDGTSVCPSQGDTNNCGVITAVIAGSSVDATAGDTILFGDVSNGGVLLDARQTSAGDDPGTAGVTEAGCSTGILEYQWSELDDLGGSVVSVVAGFSPNATVTVAPTADTTYLLEVRCSSDPGCTAAHEVQMLVYTGDGGDLGTVTSSNSPIGMLDGLFITHDPVTNEAELSWRSRPQPPGISGYNIWKQGVASANTDIFAGDTFGGAGTFCAVAAVSPGARQTQAELVMPAVGSASLYMIGHRPLNASAVSPLGARPSVSTRAGTIVSSTTCP
jgi:hypothetical protein